MLMLFASSFGWSLTKYSTSLSNFFAYSCSPLASLNGSGMITKHNLGYRMPSWIVVTASPLINMSSSFHLYGSVYLVNVWNTLT